MKYFLWVDEKYTKRAFFWFPFVLIMIQHSLFNYHSGGITFQSLLLTRWNSLGTIYKLQNHSLVIAEAACCKNSLVTRCKIRPLLVAEITRCKTSLVTRCKIRPLLVPEIARCKKSLITRCKICLILVEEVARCKKSLVTCCRIFSLQKTKFTWYSLKKLLFGKKSLVTRYKSCSLWKVTRSSF